MAFVPEVISTFKDLEQGKSLYFASDFHLGAPTPESSDLREKRIIKWLDSVKNDAAAIFLVGDIFDFWFEYGKVIPKGFIRFQAKLLELRDEGLPIYFFTGNHDAWLFNYFPKEMGIPVFRHPIVLEVGEQKLFVGHGDGLGPGDRFYKILKKIFNGKAPQFFFKWLHPDIGVTLAHKWSNNSRLSGTPEDFGFKNKESEWLWQYSKDVESRRHHDYYIFGHRHLPLELEVTGNSTYINLGEWVTQCTYGKYDGKKAQLLTYNL